MLSMLHMTLLHHLQKVEMNWVFPVYITGRGEEWTPKRSGAMPSIQSHQLDQVRFLGNDYTREKKPKGKISNLDYCKDEIGWQIVSCYYIIMDYLCNFMPWSKYSNIKDCRLCQFQVDRIMLYRVQFRFWFLNKLVLYLSVLSCCIRYCEHETDYIHFPTYITL